MDATIIEAVQSGIRKGDPDADSHVKVYVMVKYRPDEAFMPSLTSMKMGLFFQQP